MNMAAILAQVLSPATRRQCPKLRQLILIPMRLKRNPMANPVKSKYSTGNQFGPTKRRCSPAASSADDDVVGPSDSESFLSDRDELFGPKRYKRGFKCPHLKWELVSSWNKDHVAQADYEGEIARIMAKSMHDARLEVTPRYYPRAISDFRFKMVRAFQ